LQNSDNSLPVKGAAMIEGLPSGAFLSGNWQQSTILARFGNGIEVHEGEIKGTMYVLQIM
jgi:hypothetical protein